MIILNGLMRRVLLFCVVCLIMILVLQMWLGQIACIDDLEIGAKVVKYMGSVAIFLNQANLQLINTLLATKIGFEDIYNLNGTDTNSYISIEYSRNLVMNNTNAIRDYLSTLLTGNDTMDLPYDKIYDLSRDDFFYYIFGNTCDQVNRLQCDYYSNILQKGSHKAILSFIFDAESFANAAVADYSNSTVEDRWNYFKADLLPVLKLDYQYL